MPEATVVKQTGAQRITMLSQQIKKMKLFDFDVLHRNSASLSADSAGTATDASQKDDKR